MDDFETLVANVRRRRLRGMVADALIIAIAFAGAAAIIWAMGVKP